MSKKQFINASNRAPSMGLSFPWLLALTTHVLNWPVWVYGVAGTLTFCLIVAFIVRIASEEGVDVVER